MVTTAEKPNQERVLSNFGNVEWLNAWFKGAQKVTSGSIFCVKIGLTRRVNLPQSKKSTSLRRRAGCMSLQIEPYSLKNNEIQIVMRVCVRTAVATKHLERF